MGQQQFSNQVREAETVHHVPWQRAIEIVAGQQAARELGRSTD